MTLKKLLVNEDAMQLPVDAVITWVDGADPAHKAKLDEYLASIGGTRPRSASAARFHSSGEIDYCVTSLLRFAPWLRTIYIVTDAQTPDLIDKLKGTQYEDKVKVIDHKIIFSGYEQYLPTFNSMSIASMLWRIPNLSERFLFLNDDFALIRAVNINDFYRNNSVILRGSWRKMSDRKIINRLLCRVKCFFGMSNQLRKKERVRFVGVQEQSAKLLGFHERYFQLAHNPHPWLKSSWENYFNANPQQLNVNIGYKFRSAEQFVPEGFSAHYEIKQGLAVIDNLLKTLQLKPAEQSFRRLKNKICGANINQNTAFVCVQNLEQAPQENQTIITDWLNSRIGLLESFLSDQSN